MAGPGRSGKISRPQGREHGGAVPQERWRRPRSMLRSWARTSAWRPVPERPPSTRARHQAQASGQLRPAHSRPLRAMQAAEMRADRQGEHRCNELQAEALRRNAIRIYEGQKSCFPISLNMRSLGPPQTAPRQSAADKSVKQFHHVEGGHRLHPAPAQAIHQLQQAARISRKHGLRASRKKIFHLAIAELVRCLRLQQVINASRTAAQRALGNLSHFQPRNSAEQLPRLRLDALRVQQMAGIVISDAHLEWLSRRLRLQFAKNLGDVLASCRESSGARSPGRVVAQKIAVFLHGRSAAGGIDNNSVHLRSLEDRDHLPGQFGSFVFQSGVNHQRATAGLFARNHNLAAFRGQHARSSRVHVRKEDLLHAPTQHSHAAARQILWPNNLRQSLERMRRHIRQQRLHRCKILRQQLWNSHRAYQRPHAALLIDEQWQRHQPQPFGVRKCCEYQCAEEPLAQTAWHVALYLRARRLNEFVVLHTRWERRHAGHATQAAVHMLPEALIQRRLALGGLLDHVNSTARRVHLFAPKHVRRTCRQAKAAMHAVVDVFLLRRMMRVETGRALFVLHDGMRHKCQMFPTKRPGLRMRLGSKRRFISRISGSAFESQPHTSRPFRNASGNCWATTLPPETCSLPRRCLISAIAASGEDFSATVIKPGAWATIEISAPSLAAHCCNSAVTGQTSLGSNETLRTTAPSVAKSSCRACQTFSDASLNSICPKSFCKRPA